MGHLCRLWRRNPVRDHARLLDLLPKGLQLSLVSHHVSAIRSRFCVGRMVDPAGDRSRFVDVRFLHNVAVAGDRAGRLGM